MAYCTCEKCKKITEREGSVSGNVLAFVNRVAEALEQDYPDVQVLTIVYKKVTDVPKFVRPRKNVIIQICGSMVRSHSVAQAKELPILQDEDDIQTVYNRFDEWGKVSEKIYTWDYPAPYLRINSVFPHFHTLWKNKEFFADHNVKGVFINGNTDTCQFSEMTVYLLAKLLWDPYIGEREYYRLMDEFLEGFYGDGGKYIREFIEYTRELSEGKVYYCTSEPKDIISVPVDEKTGLPDLTVIEKMQSCFDRALSLAKTAQQRYYLKKAALQVAYFKGYTASDLLYENGDEQMKAQIVAENKRLYEESKKYSVLRINERMFLPIVKDFRQSPETWGYWDLACVEGDKNNLAYDRDNYSLLRADGLTLGEYVDVRFSFQSSNVVDGCYLKMLGKDGFVYFTKNGEKAPVYWDEYKTYQTVCFKNVKITNLAEIAVAAGKRTDDYDFRFIPKEECGVILCIDNLGAGAYYMIKDVSITRADGEEIRNDEVLFTNTFTLQKKSK